MSPCRSLFLALCALLLCATACAQTLPALAIDPNLVSVSGLSSGAFFAVQYHVAFSDELVGAGVVAGGPFYCALGEEAIAITECMNEPSAISLSVLYAATSAMAAAGDIANPQNLNGSAVYLFSGTKDTVVNPGTMTKLQQYYQNYHADVTTEFTIPAEHSIVTNAYGNPCSELGSPYINNCQYDSAGKMLNVIYSNLQAPTADPDLSYIFPFSIAPFLPSGVSAAAASLSSTSYIFIPPACYANTTGAPCKLHVAHHGCNQNYVAVGGDFVEHAGYLQWAQTNNIVVLFPQTATTALKNPDGCFDWWGYTGHDYATIKGVQMATVHSMVTSLVGPARARK